MKYQILMGHTFEEISDKITVFNIREFIVYLKHYPNLIEIYVLVGGD